MPPRTTPSNKALGDAIKARRLELGLTIEDAAFRAGVGTKTWVRYESGSAIRTDKVHGICKALRWAALGGGDEARTETYDLNIDEKSLAWPDEMCKCYGRAAAVSFVAGSEILLDYTTAALERLASMPHGSHVGELGVSWLKDLLPQQFLTRYDYEFVYAFKCSVCRLRESAEHTGRIHVHTTTDLLAIRSMCECAGILMGEWGYEPGWDDWAKDLYMEADVDYYLYSDEYVPRSHSLHFDWWNEW